MKYKKDCKIIIELLDNISDEKISNILIKDSRKYYYKKLVSNNFELKKRYNEFLQMINKLNDLCHVKTEIKTYKDIQQDERMRNSILEVFKHEKYFSKIFNPKEEKMHVRIPCPICGLIEKTCKDISFEYFDDKTIIRGLCPEHGSYDVVFSPQNTEYIDINIPFRHFCKGLSLVDSDNENNGLSIQVLGNDFAYAQNETKITDIQNREYTYQFNNLGQTTGIVSNADGQAQYFDYAETESVTDSRANKLISESKVLHSVTNYVIDPGFHVTNLETYYDPRIQDTSDAVSITLDTTKCNITDNSVKVYKPETNTGYAHLFQYVKNLDDGEYTLSAYINTEGETISGGGVYLGYILYDADGNQIGAARAEKIFKTDGWERFSMPFTIKDGQYIRFQVGMQGDSNTPAHGTFWVDDIQVEKSTGMSSYNMLENSDFTNGKNPWSTGATLTTISDLPGYTKAISRVGDPTKTYWGLTQDIFASGKKDDVFSIGAWVKADSAPINNLKDEDTYKPQFALGLLFCDSDGNIKKTETVPLNDDLNTWQFVSGKVIAPVDYERLRFIIIYYSNVNTVMTTGGFCFKEEFGQTYTYDDNGNVISSVDLANSKSSFAFKGDQMAKMLNPSGSEYFYSYGYDNKNLNTAVSTDGQRYSFTYDSKGNVLTSKIEADKPATTIEDGKYYVIRNAESGNVMDNNSGKGTVHNWRFRNGQGNQIWQAIESDEAGIYYLKSVSHDGHYLAVKDNSNTNNATMTTATAISGNAFKFKLQANDNGTFTILTKTSNYTKCVDGQPSSSKDYEDGGVIQQCTKNADDESQQWYFYPDISSTSGATQQEYISTSATYTDNQNFVASQTDQRGNATTYNYNETTGTLTSVTDASNNTTSYVYNANNNALQSVTSGGMTNSYTYTDDRLTDINVNGGTRYQFTYDSFGRTTETKVGNGTNYLTLSSLKYNIAGLLMQQIYGNGDYITFEYDTLDRLIGKSYNGSSTDKVEYFYGADGNISKTIDYSTNTRTKYVYDLAGRIVSTRDYKNGYSDHAGLKAYVEYTYADKTNYLTGIKHYNALGTQNIGYRYGDIASGEMPDQIYGVTWNGQQMLDYTYDGLGRLTNKSLFIYGSDPVNDSIDTTYTYVDVTGSDNKTTTLLKSISTAGATHTYEYDELGNITSIYDGSKYNTYEYDELNQLVRENLGYENETYTYEYENGNIKYKHKYAYTTGTLPETPVRTIQYHYEDDTWGDVLTKITEITYSNTSTASTYSVGAIHESPASTNPLAQSLFGNNYNTVDLTENALINVGSIHESTASTASTYSVTSNTTTLYTIGSDTIGNITNIGNVTLDWNGRRLESISQDGTEVVTYDYNIDGQRVKKTVNGVTTEYFYNGSILAGQKKGDDVLVFMYDNNGDIFGFTYNGTPYYYVKNAQNDVYLIVDENGQAVVLYQYDAWGKVTACVDATDFGLASINPIMYRSYYVDLEMGMFVYYLNSRYYIADWGRFASADGQINEDALGGNIFAYCSNNPVNRTDATGRAWYHWAIGAAVVVGCAVATVATAGSFAFAMTAFGFATMGVTVGGATGVFAMATVASATFLTASAAIAACNSNSVEDFNNQGSWLTVAGTAASAFVGGAGGYIPNNNSSSSNNSSSNKNTPVIGKMADLDKTTLNSNEFKVADLLPNQGSPKANWQQNSSVLRSFMDGRAIRDVSAYPMENAGFLGAERNLLSTHGYVYENGYWIMP